MTRRIPLVEPVEATRSRHVTFLAWRQGQFGTGVHLGTDPASGLSWHEAVGSRRYADPYGDATPREYEWAAWVSPEVAPAHPFTWLVPSWNARTPDDSWLEVEARTSTHRVGWSPWVSLGRWAESDHEIHPASVGGQDSSEATVATDVLQARDGITWSSYQLRVTLLRRAGSAAEPSVSLLGAVTSLPGWDDDPDDRPDSTPGVELDVPPYSQEIHRGEYPELNSGGEAWCSPASTSMVLGHWGLGPSEAELSWVADGITDPVVDHAARFVYDHAYGGAGNWTFNTAYAARYGTEGFVTRLRSIAEMELFLRAGIPLVVSLSFQRADLDGAGYDTRGHLLTVIGVDDRGDVVCNDPASHGVPSNDEVRVVYKRDQFERAWRRSSGVTYVIHPHDVPLPPAPRPDEPNW